MDVIQQEKIRQTVRENYGKIAAEGRSCCSPGSCCGDSSAAGGVTPPGYDAAELATLPEGADLGLGCGNPVAIAALRPGETVLDLGSGGGIDCFLAARKVGENGMVIGVDMTPEMVARARENAQRAGVRNVSFRLGEIEHLPVADTSVDVILSNCVINLAPDKAAVAREAFRVLKPGGRLAVSDIVALQPLPPDVQNDVALLVGCVAGATPVEAFRQILLETGFTDVRIDIQEKSRELINAWVPGKHLDQYVASATIEAVKPG